MNTALVLDWPLGRWRWRQDSPVSIPRCEHGWRAHTEPDGLKGYVWLTEAESDEILYGKAV